MESITGIVWCKTEIVNEVKSWIVSQFNNIIWTYLKPTLTGPISSTSFSRLNFGIIDSGDIQDEECVTKVLMSLCKAYPDITFKIKTAEGDFLMFETAQLVDESVTIPDQTSVVHNGELHHVDDSISSFPDLPMHLNDETKFESKVQTAFQAFISQINSTNFYQYKNLFIPEDLKKLLIYDPKLISTIIRKSSFSKSVDFRRYTYCEHSIKFRKYQFAYLDSMDVRVPRSFGLLCPTQNRSLRYIRFSFLLTVGYHNSEEELSNEIKRSQNIKTEETQHEDDDESWLNDFQKPEYSFEDIGTQMAERVGEFMKEISQFDSVEADGPINFDFDSYKSKLEHFLDSSSDEEEEEDDYEEDELLEHLEDEDEKILRKVADGKMNANEYVSSFLEQSYETQPIDSGPTSDLMQLFNLRK
ncbi:protein ecdysoneless [Histomonas meleagridis]|uniref:protein ecdysoneless n=1 Tax=Histomonas meleagridis TaxID=135588 RepID=UPI003559EEC3|nr:protein ecdysoneless [Histomonas meleagridis]KAH0800188.1 protein ecdysoneless [Histomonas meleagridis]